MAEPVVVEMTKRCPRCEQIRSLAEFTIRQSGRRIGQPIAHCKPCEAEKSKDRHKRDPSIYRRIEWPSKLKRYYGITVADYYRMLADQNGGCAICGASKPCEKRTKKYAGTEMFFVDHCHSTGRVRGLLCNKCNQAIGFFDDNPLNAERAALYLRRI